MPRSRDLDRRQFVTGGAVATLAVAACSRGTPGEPSAAAEPSNRTPTPPVPAAEPGIVRVVSVKTAVEGRLLPTLIETFERTSPYRVRLVTGVQVYDLARQGKADLVISHYGHKDAEAFVQGGLGE